jgi:hypothetical protein
MRGSGLAHTLNKLLIVMLVGLFTAAELLYLPPEYKFGLAQLFALVKGIFG